MKLFSSFIAVPMLLYVACVFSSCANGSKLIQQTKSYYYQKQQGNVQADANGNEIHSIPDTVILIYTETSSQLLKWDTGWVNNRVYRIVAVPVKTLTIDAGSEKISREKVIIAAKPGHYLYELYLEPVAGVMPAGPQLVNKDIPILQGRYKGRMFYKTCTNLVELETVPAL
jgi:hypothetical protein